LGLELSQKQIYDFEHPLRVEFHK